MGLEAELIQQMASDLNIYPYKDEKEEAYWNRLLFSGIGLWILYTALDINVNDTELYKMKGVSKSYITRKVSKIVTEYIALFPSFKPYITEKPQRAFKKTSKEIKEVVQADLIKNENKLEINLVPKLREYYEQAGFLVSIGFGEFLTLAETKTAEINNTWQIIRNDFGIKKIRMVGLGMYAKSQLPTEKVHRVHQIFYLQKLTAQDWTAKNIEALNWKKASKLSENAQYFDPNRRKNNSDCWIDTYPKNCDITLYKINDWDYGFAKKVDNRYIGIYIPDYLIGVGNVESAKLYNNDVRRFMNGLKALNNNPINAYAKKKEGYWELKLNSALPERERIALQFLGWHQNLFMDEYHYIIPTDLFSTVKEILGNLSIIIEEEN